MTHQGMHVRTHAYARVCTHMLIHPICMLCKQICAASDCQTRVYGVSLYAHDSDFMMQTCMSYLSSCAQACTNIYIVLGFANTSGRFDGEC